MTETNLIKIENTFSYLLETEDCTFSNLLSQGESKFIIKAVGSVLLEIDHFISNSEIKHDKTNISRHSSDMDWRVLSGHDKRANFISEKVLSHDEIKQCPIRFDEPIESTYHRRDLDRPISKTRKPANVNNGSLKWNELDSTRFCVKKGLKLMNITESDLVERSQIDSFSRSGEVYSINSSKVNINSFVISFYKHYPQVSYSSFILSLIYIDRFIKSQCKEGLKGLANFNMLK